MKTLSIEINDCLELTLIFDTGTEQIQVVAGLTEEIARQLADAMKSPASIREKSFDRRLCFGAYDFTRLRARSR